MQAAIEERYGITATLRERVCGIFEVFIGKKVVHSNQETYRFLENEEIFETLQYIPAARSVFSSMSTQ